MSFVCDNFHMVWLACVLHVTLDKPADIVIRLFIQIFFSICQVARVMHVVCSHHTSTLIFTFTFKCCMFFCFVFYWPSVACGLQPSHSIWNQRLTLIWRRAGCCRMKAHQTSSSSSSSSLSLSSSSSSPHRHHQPHHHRPK